ncbi:HbrB-like protein [Lizonia empirigonia]|nr:HbrB-like protein [Lizonia empirigonia]
MPPPSPPPQTPGLQRPSLDEYDSDGSQATLQQTRRSPMHPRAVKSPSAEGTTTPAPNYSRPAIIHATQSQTSLIDRAHVGHRPRQRSQGYFEPSLSSMRNESLMAPPSQHLTASHMAAQAAYQQSAQHMRRRSTTVPAPVDNSAAAPSIRSQPMSPPPMPSNASMTFKTNGMTYQQGLVANRSAAATAANAAYPTSPLTSPSLEQTQPQGTSGQASPRLASATPELVLQKAPKEKSKMKLFSSRPKKSDVDQPGDKKHQALPSPGKMGIGIHSSQALNRIMNQSTTSLLDSGVSSSGTSIYSSANASTSTLVPKNDPYAPQEKEKHKHHFLSRTKNKLKDKDDHALPLSSASSTSRPTNPNAPESLLDATYRDRNPSFSTERAEWPSLASSLSNTPGIATPGTAIPHTTEMLNLGSSFGLSGLSPDDAWPLLKARVLLIFEGEDPRPPVEDFNALVTVHIKRCIHKRSPILLIEDLNELLYTGFGSLDQTLRHVPDERLIPHLVEMWLVVFTTILPFLQAVFLPLDLEFRGTGIMNSIQASEFWGVMLPDEMNTKSPTHKNIPILGELEVRRITLLMFRDIVILPRYDSLMAIFSRLSLENLNAGLDSPSPIPDARPGTASSVSEALTGMVGSLSTNATSHSSAGYLESTSSSLPPSGRSRATSNTSAGSFSSNPHSHPSTLHPPTSLPTALRQQPMDSAKVTETVGRMLQCVSVLVSLQSSDESQDKMTRMSKELKYNWLGRGRTGRQRQGFVGPRRGGGLPLGALSLNLPEEVEVGA